MKKKIIASVMALIMALCMFPAVSQAGDYTVSKSGAYTMSALGYASGDRITIADGLTVTLIGDSTVTYTNLEISCGAGVTLTLSNVNIDDSGNDLVAPVKFTGTGNTLMLADGTVSTLKAGRYCAGVETNVGVELTIRGEGTLNAVGQGRNEENQYYGAAGIGGGSGYSAGSITIAGGTINASGGFEGAGIGSGNEDSIGCGHENSATVTITGGSVTATGGEGAAGIGGGFYGTATVNVTGGTVSATGGGSGAGIGGGQLGSGTVNISGGVVSSVSTRGGAGIGGGQGGCGTVKISGGDVTAKGSTYGAGIGGCDGSAITISGGSVTATGGSVGSGVGASRYGGTFTVTISGGTVNATGNAGAGIGTAYSDSSGSISISGGTVFAAYSRLVSKDIDSGTSGNDNSVNISGSAAVFMKHDTITDPTASTHAHSSYDAGTTSVYGISVPSGWTDAFGAYLRVCTINYDANGGSGAPSAVSQLYGTTASVPSGSGVKKGNYGFKGWNTKADGTGTAYKENDTFTLSGTDTLYAQWGGTKVTAAPNNASYGSVTGGGEYEPGADVTVTAAANEGYYFEGWYKGDTLVSSSASYKFTSAGDVTLTAKFNAYINVIAVSSNDLYGSVSGGGKYAANAPAALKATANSGYYFIGWYKGDTLVSSSDSYAFTALESVTLTAKFVSYITVTALSGNAAYGSISGGGAYKPGTDVTVTAMPNTGYYFTGWYQGGALVSSNASYTFTAGNDVTLTAQFDAVGIAETITATVPAYNKIALTWSAAGGASGYGVYRSTAENGTYKLIAAAASLSYTDTKISAGTTYYYKVKAFRLTGKTKVYGNYYSATVSATAALGQVTGVSAAPSDPRTVKITWSSLNGAAKYEVWRSTSDGIYTLVGATSSRKFINTGLTTDVQYSYKVVAYRNVNGEAVYGGYSEVKTATPAVAKVMGVKAARINASQVRISWNAVTGAKKYEIWASDTENGTYTLLGETSSKSYTDTPALHRYYKIRAYNTVVKTQYYGEYSSVVTP